MTLSPWFGVGLLVGLGGLVLGGIGVVGWFQTVAVRRRERRLLGHD